MASNKSFMVLSVMAETIKNTGGLPALRKKQKELEANQELQSETLTQKTMKPVVSSAL